MVDEIDISNVNIWNHLAGFAKRHKTSAHFDDINRDVVLTTPDLHVAPEVPLEAFQDGGRLCAIIGNAARGWGAPGRNGRGGVHAEQNWAINNFSGLVDVEPGDDIILGYRKTPCDDCFVALRLLAQRVQCNIKFYAIEPYEGGASDRWPTLARMWAAQERRRLAEEQDVEEQQVTVPGRVHPLIVFGSGGDVTLHLWHCSPCPSSHQYKRPNSGSRRA